MVFVRVHVLENYLNAEQKKHLGAELIAAVAHAEGLVNSERQQQTSWVQYFEIDRENWYAPVMIGNPSAFWQIEVIGPQEYLPTPKEARLSSRTSPRPSVQWWATTTCGRHVGRGYTSTPSHRATGEAQVPSPTSRRRAPTSHPRSQRKRRPVLVLGRKADRLDRVQSSFDGAHGERTPSGRVKELADDRIAE